VTFAVGSSDAYPYVCGVYTCPCGRRSIRHGRLAALLPAGWIERRAADDEPVHVCDICAGTLERQPEDATRS
jgi:hypothetical protein